MPHCENCDCYLPSETAILEHVAKEHGIQCRLGKPHEAYCEKCHVYCGKKHKSTSIVVLEKHLKKKHDVNIEGCSAVSTDNIVNAF